MTVFEDRFQLGPEAYASVLDAALSRGGDFAELFLEYRLHSSVLMEEDILKETSESVSLGLGVRVWSGERTGYGHTNDLSPERMVRAARSAAAVAFGGGPSVSRPEFAPIAPLTGIYHEDSPASAADLEAKIDLVRRAYAACLGRSREIKKARAAWGDAVQHLTVVNSEGLIVSDVRPMVKLTCLGIAERGSVREYGFSGGGGRAGLEVFGGLQEPEVLGREAADEAVRLLEAGDAPAGEMPVILAPGHAGVLIHEAVGHLLEADFHRKKTSVFWNKMGARVGSNLVTIYDDPTIPSARGSYAVDDEGTIPSKTLLIDQGIVAGLLTDRMSAKILGRPLTGHGRRQGYADIPIPRMANTFIAAGPHDPAEILASVKKGFFASRFTGGQVEDSGKFTFSVSSGWLIEDGRLTRPVKQATLIGTNIDILNRITMAGNDLLFGQPTGTCGKEGQEVPVNDGCPTLKISSMTVGGRT
ncbi:MAG: TldD/PmbA family protein [Candidatus Aminicenantes bacterium]|nr:TldD/PmbA family protein [Candidatus Aminicenantes bacterium]